MSTTEQFHNDQPAPQPDVPWLRAAREQKGITLEGLANSTKICPKYLKALEAGAADQLPPAFFIRGFVKTYAKEVGLDPNRTADRYLGQLMPAMPAAEGENVRAIVETAVARTGVIGFDKHHAPLINSLHPDSSGRLVLALAMVGAILYIGPFTWDGFTSKIAAIGVAQPAAVESAPAPAAAPQPAAQAPRPELATQDIVSGPIKFKMKPQSACWFSATADGNPAHSELLQAGDTRQFDVSEALMLRVGDADACAFSINGRAARAPGSPGAPVTVRITKDNYRDFVLRGL